MGQQGKTINNVLTTRFKTHIYTIYRVVMSKCHLYGNLYKNEVLEKMFKQHHFVYCINIKKCTKTTTENTSTNITLH